MKRLIVKFELNFIPEVKQKIEQDIQKQWSEGSVIILPVGVRYEIVEDTKSEAAIWLDQEIARRKEQMKPYEMELKLPYEKEDLIKATWGVADETEPHVVYRCSHCEETQVTDHIYTFKYCPNCGAKMKGKRA